MSNNLSPNPIIQISKCSIRPKHDYQRAHHHFVHNDICFLAGNYIQKGLLFNKPQHLNVQYLLDKLKNGISITLDYYYPLAGQFVTVKEDGDTCWMYLDPNKGPGASYIYAVCSDVTVDDVVKSKVEMIPIIRGFFELGDEYVVNYDGHTRALLCVQVTELIDGVFIGFTMNHSVADGSTFWNFINCLSEIFNSIDADGNTNVENLKLSRAPIIKHLPGDGCDPIIKLPYSKLIDFVTKFRAKVDPNLRERIFHFSSSSIANLKARANAQFSKDGSMGQISSFQSLIALLWTSITRARNLDPDLVTACTLAADAKARYDPPLPSNYFGNFIIPIMMNKKVGELMQNGFAWVAMELHQGVENYDKKLVHERCKSLFGFIFGPNTESAASVFGGETALVIGGSVRFNMYGPEFGLGKAIAVRTGYSAKTNGKVTTNPGPEGEGSVEAEISLPSHVMSALEQDHDFMSFVTQVYGV